MAKEYLRFIAVFITMLLISSTYAFLTPNVRAAEATSKEKGLSILSNVVDLNLTKYKVTPKEYPQSYNSSYLGVVPQEDVDYDLVSEGSRVKALFTFANSRLQMIHVLENEGSPHVTKTAANSLELAKNFFSNYQAYTADSLYGELKSTLDNVDASKNVTKTTGNTQLEVTANNGYTTFKWTCTSNGAIAPSKFVALGFNSGFLTCFVDNWHLYKIGSTSVTLSEQEAKAIALETAKAHNWSLKLDADAFEAKNFNESNVRWTALIFDGSLGANKTRSSDPLMLYPVWRVGVALNKWYGQLYGIEVDIWADTKEVRYVQEAWSTMPPPEGMPTANMSTVGASNSQVSNAGTNNMLNGQASTVAGAEPNLIMWIALPTLAIATIGTTSVWVCRKKKSQSYNLPKPRSLKTGGTMLCILILFTVLLASIATVSATTRAGVVWGSESTGAGEYPYSWRKSSTEIDWQRSISNTIASYFAQGGYDAYNDQGSHGSTSAKYNILNDLSYYQSTHDSVAVVDFDHGVGLAPGYPALPGEFHFMFEDNTGTLTGDYPGTPHPENGVYDMDIYPKITLGKVFFAFINTCLSANITAQTSNPGIGQGLLPAQGSYPERAEGMPFAWTHRLVKDKGTYPGFNIADHISDDGYSDPDDGSQCYIGFPWGAASLEQRIPYNTGSQYYHTWVDRFFDYGLRYDMSVNMALDHASWQTWGNRFGDCHLRTGFQAYWWTPGDGAWPHVDSTMVVYGSGYVHLRYYTQGWSDNFNDNSMDTAKWEKLQVNGATASETTGQLAVTVPSGTGWAQAGYVTKYAYNVKDCKTTITVSDFGDLDEMTLQICTTKTTSSDPFSENNWYRILKARYDSKVYVQNKINGVLSTKVATNWASATGELTIDICDGSIALYENGNMRYAEPYALSSYNCYIYAFTSTLKSGASRTDKFDNFALAPTTSFWDYFDDASNYYGWTVDSGSWQVTSGQLRSTAYNSHIHVNTAFATSRTVKTDIQTLSHTGDPWYVPWLYVKEQDGNNNVYALIHTTGTVELSMFYQGQQTMWFASSSLDPYYTHALTVSIIGTNAKVWVDGTLYLDVYNSNFANLAGYVGLYTPSSTGAFDNVVVLD